MATDCVGIDNDDGDGNFDHKAANICLLGYKIIHYTLQESPKWPELANDLLQVARLTERRLFPAGGPNNWPRESPVVGGVADVPRRGTRFTCPTGSHQLTRAAALGRAYRTLAHTCSAADVE